jgi:transcription elongation GreA/GreB family factor
MNRQDYLHLRAECQFLNERLATLPEKAWITRQSAESRLRAIEAELAEAKIDEREPARTRLTFTGRPVVDSYGILAEFGVTAVGQFTEAVAAVAASIQAPLAAMGPIPNREQNQLLKPPAC